MTQITQEKGEILKISHKIKIDPLKMLPITLRPVLKFFAQKLLECCNTNGTTLLSKKLVFWIDTFL